MTAPKTTRGAGSPDQVERKRRGGLLPILLGVVALFVIGTALLGTRGDDPKDIASLPGAKTEPENPTIGSSAGTAGEGGSLVAAGQPLLDADVPAERVVGETATGRTVVVQEVVDGEGFFVGQTEQDRVYVEFGGDVGEDETDGGLPAAGDRVDLTGPVRPAPENPGRTLNLSESQAADVEQDGFFINAETVRPR